MVEFRYRLQELMVYYNISQADLVKKTGISKSMVSNYLSGNRNPKQDKLEILSRCYGVSLTWLLGVENVPMFEDVATAPITPKKQKQYEYQINETKDRVEVDPKQDNLEDILKMYFTLSDTDKETVNNMITFLASKKA